ncbi:MAG: ferritin family protein [Magnetospirillum sp.]|nr:ferritin family protein [Magnetospirillum sp.]
MAAMTNPPAINPLYPVTEPASIEALMDIAVGLEDEAARRYEQLAAKMAANGETDLAAVFRTLGDLERRHERGLSAWAERDGGRPPHPAAFAWQLPETFGDDEPLDPVRALAIAVRNEERAFAFYTYLAALAADRPALRERAEALAREELNHVAQLRHLRRRAWHTRPRTRAPERTLVSLCDVAKGLEGGSAELTALAARALAECGRHDEATRLRTAAAECRRRSGEGSRFGHTGSSSAEAARAAGLLAPGALTVDGALHLAGRDAEEVLAVYLAAADAAPDEAQLTEAQRLAETALARLALIRAQIRARSPGGR